MVYLSVLKVRKTFSAIACDPEKKPYRLGSKLLLQASVPQAGYSIFVLIDIFWRL